MGQLGPGRRSRHGGGWRKQASRPPGPASIGSAPAPGRSSPLLMGSMTSDTCLSLPEPQSPPLSREGKTIRV